MARLIEDLEGNYLVMCYIMPIVSLAGNEKQSIVANHVKKIAAKRIAAKRSILEKGSRNSATMSIIMVSETTVGITLLVCLALCCVFCAMECECCGECGRGEPFDAATARDAAEGEVVSNPIEV